MTQKQGRSRPRPIDWPAVLELWEHAAELGHARAMFYIGVSYEHGNGFAQDLTQALRWYEKAAELGREAAMYNLAFSHREGDGVPQNYEQMHYLDAAYREMAQDKQREEDALEWAEGTLMTEEELNATP